MRIWPFKMERREVNYTELVLQALASSAGGSNLEAAVAAVEVAVGLWGRAMASATVTPETPATRALTPSVLASIGRGLILPGSVLFEIVVDDGELYLQPAGTWNISGRTDAQLVGLRAHDERAQRNRDPDACGIARRASAICLQRVASLGVVRSAGLLEHDATAGEVPRAAPGAGSGAEGWLGYPHATRSDRCAPRRY